MISRRNFIAVAGFLALAVASSLLTYGADKLIPIPTDAAQAEATKLAKEVYGDDYAKAKSFAQKQALAKKLLGKAEESDNDSVGRFVLLRLARDIATQANDAQTAFQAIDTMADIFRVDGAKMKGPLLAKFASVAQQPSQHQFIATEALKLADQAISREDYTAANEYGKTSLAEARSALDKELISEARDRITDSTELTKTYVAVKAARLALEKTPGNPDANLVMGKYYCFAKNDWDKGMPMLALGNDEALKALAVQELQGAASSTEQATLGDGWWNQAENQDERTKKVMKARAGVWYAQALPGLSGLAKGKVEKRLAAEAASGRRVFERAVANKPIRMKSSVRRYALSEFGWNDKEPKSVSLIGKNQGFAFVSYVEGSLRGPGEEIDLRTDPNGSWILTGRSKQRLFIKAAAVHMLSAREFLPAKSQEFTWKTGAPRTKMLRQDEGCCFLTGLGGSFLGEGESINVTRDQDGFWYLEGPAKQSVVAYAVGIPFAEGFRPEINEYTWQAGEPVKMIDRNEGVCFLTSLRGNFGGQDAVGLSIHNDGHWYLEGRSSRLQAKAVSVSWSR